ETRAIFFQRPQNEIGAAIGQVGAERARQRQPVAPGWRDGHQIGQFGKDAERMEKVKTVLAPAHDVQCKIDLGRGGLAERFAHQSSIGASGSSPLSNLGLARSVTTPSSSTSMAMRHWNMASRSRPAVQ